MIIDSVFMLRNDVDCSMKDHKHLIGRGFVE